MRNRGRYLLVPVGIALLLAPPALATTYVMMTDEDLADQASLIALVRVVDVRPTPGGRPSTDYFAEIERLIKGRAPDRRLTLRVLGGRRSDGTWLKIWAAPAFRKGERALLFLEPRPDRTYGVLQFMLGAFHEAQADGRSVAWRDLREAREVAGEREHPRDLERFADWLSDRAKGIRRERNYLVEAEVTHQPVTEPFTLLGSGFRWFEFDTGGSVTWRAHQSGQSGMSGGGFTQFQNALQSWNNEPLTPINLVYGGTTSASGGFQACDGVNEILFDDPNGEIAGSFSCIAGGVLAIGGVNCTSGSGTFKGMTYSRIAEGAVVTQNGAGCFFAGHGNEDGEEVFGHELGHAIGLGHSCGDGSSGPCNTTAKDEALMRATAHGDGRGAQLGTDDEAGAQFIYQLPAPSVAFTTASSSVAEAGATASAVVRITTSDGSATSSTTTVNYATQNGTAMAAQDYVSSSGVLTFPSGTPSGSTQTINVSVLNDAIDEANETFSIVITSVSGAALGTPSSHVVTITDDDAPPTLSINDAPLVTEGNAGGASAVFTVSLSSASGQTLSVNFATADGNATAGSDYAASSGTRSVPAGVLTGTISVPVIGDTLDEENEAFLVSLSNPVNVVIADGQGQGTILDDDGRAALCRPILSIPYTITAQGRYCLTKNLSTSITTGAAVTINSDFVVLDLQGFKIGGGAAGLGTQAKGVYAVNRKNITIKNGNIRGFLRAVFLEDDTGTFTTSQGHLIQAVRADENTFAGIHVQGRGIVVRNNQVVTTGGTTVFGADADAYGIVTEGPAAKILNNDVTDTVEAGAGLASAIAVSSAAGTVVERNRLGNSSLGSSFGVRAISGADVMIVGNRIATMGSGVQYESATGKFRDNVTSGVVTPYSGGTDVGNNN